MKHLSCLPLVVRYERLTIAHFDHFPAALTVFGSGDASITDMMAFSDKMRPLIQGFQFKKPSKAAIVFNVKMLTSQQLQIFRSNQNRNV